MPHREAQIAGDGLTFHRLPWLDFDTLAQGRADTGVVRRLRRAERSRRLLLLRSLVDDVTKEPGLFGPLPSPEEAWELLARAEARSPAAFELVLAHPYTGSWAGYTTRLLRNQITGVCPLWMHIGYLHALAASAAIHAGLDFQATVPLWDGGAILPSLGMARLTADSPWSVAEVRGEHGRFDVGTETSRVRLPSPLDADAPGWWSIRRATPQVGKYRLAMRLDDLDPYRGLYEPVPPQRIGAAEVDAWRRLLDEAWQLIVDRLPDLARAVPAGLDSLVPRPTVPFRNPSASTGDAFGSAIVARPQDAASLAATLIHEFHHILLGELLHLAHLHEDDQRERFYVPWRDDPRPLGRVLQGVYAFFGVTAFWRAVVQGDTGAMAHRAAFEFAYWRGQTWRTLGALRDDASLTPTGHRFVEGIAERLGPWWDEQVPADVAELADAVATDHYAGWRIRHLRPRPDVVAGLTRAWLAGCPRPPAIDSETDQEPTPVPDGSWSCARADLIGLRLAHADRNASPGMWSAVPDATPADLAYTSGRYTGAVRGYRAELIADPDRPASAVGLGLALAALGTGPAARALLHHPELVRAVHRKIRTSAASVPTLDGIAAWIGQSAH